MREIITQFVQLLASAAPPAKQTVVVSTDQKLYNEMINLYPDFDHSTYDTKFIKVTEQLCTFLATTRYKKVILLYHGTLGTIELDKEKGIQPFLTSIVENINKKTITSAITELKFYSCLIGASAKALFELATILKCKIEATTMLRARNYFEFDSMPTDSVISKIDIFKDYFIYSVADNRSTKSSIANHGNKLFFEYFFPLGYDNRQNFIKSINFVTASREELLDKRAEMGNKRLRPFNDAQLVTISSLQDAEVREIDYKAPQGVLFHAITIVPPVENTP